MQINSNNGPKSVADFLPPRPAATNSADLTGMPSGVQPGKFKPEFERVGSTYSWKFFLSANPNESREKALYGHSKPKDGNEIENKQKLLENILFRLKNRDYFTRFARMDVYRNFSDFAKDSDLFLSMYREHYIIQPRYMNQQWLIELMQKFYANPLATYGNSQDPFPTSYNSPGVVRPAVVPFPVRGYENILDHAKRYHPRSEQEYTKTLEFFYMEVQKGTIPVGQLQEWQRIVSTRLKK